jgi:hypothetical protein
VRWRGVVALVGVVVLAAVLAQTREGHAVLQRAGLYEQPTSYTSLAFEHPQSLPDQLTSKRANVDVSFVIRNATGARHGYRWSVLLVQGQRSRRVFSGTVGVAPGREATVIRTAAVFCTRGQVRIVVTLALPAEAIDAWLACVLPKR